MAMAHARKLNIMRTTLVAILFAIVLWVIVQLAIGANATAAIEEREDWCLATGISSIDCTDPQHDAAFNTREGVR